MTWIPLVAAVVVLMAYAWSLRPKAPCSGECVFCAIGRHAANSEPSAPARTATDGTSLAA